MYYIVETEKSFDQTVADLEVAVAGNNFSVLHIHNLGEKLRDKGLDFSNECKVFEVCNPVYSSEIMAIDMKINMALPCRISVYTEGEVVKIGAIKPSLMISTLSDDLNLVTIANTVENLIITMINSAK